MDKEEQILNSLASLRSVLEKPEVQPKPWYEVVRTWLPTILLVLGMITYIVGPWTMVIDRIDRVAQDVKVIQWVIRDLHSDNEDVKEWIPNPFGDRGIHSSYYIIPKEYGNYCIVNNKERGL